MIVPPSYPPPVLPRLTPAAARLCNRLLSLSGPWTLPEGLGTARLEALGAAFIPVCRLMLVCGEDIWQVEMNSTAWLHAHPALTEMPDDPETALPPTLQEAVLENLAQGVCRSLERVLKLPVRVDGVSLEAGADTPPADVTAQQAEGITLCLELSALRAPLWARCTASSPSLLHLIDCLVALPLRENTQQDDWIDCLPLALHFEAGSLLLPAPQLAALVPGDILLPQDYPAARQRLHVRVGAWRLPCTLPEPGRAVLEALSPNPDLLDIAMPNDVLDDLPNEQSQNLDMDALEIPVVFELEEQRITLRKLRQMTPGHIFALHGDPAAPVTLRIHGKAMGTGRLVDINGTLGVQVLTLGLVSPLQGAKILPLEEND